MTEPEDVSLLRQRWDPLPLVNRRPSSSAMAHHGQSAAEIPRTSDVPFFSSLHGRERRALRGIDKIDLQAAVLHGTKEPGWPHPATGAARWKYTHANIVYITDESSTQEITSYAEPVTIPRAGLSLAHVRDHEAAKERLRIDPSSCTSHTVLVVDQSASMKTCDIFDFRNRSMAVFGMLAIDFVAKQRISGEATDKDVVSLVLMRNEAEVVFEREPMGLVLYNRLVGLHDDGVPRSHGNFLPALDEAKRLLNSQVHGGCALSLLFLSDGRPSDHVTLGLPSATSLIIDRVRDLSTQLSVATLGFASRDQDFSVLEAMAGAAREAGSQGEFHRPELSSEGLGTAIAHSVSSLTATRLRLTTLATQDKQPRALRKVDRETAGSLWSHAPTTIQTGTGWVLYMDGVQRFKFSRRAFRRSQYPWVPVARFSEEANGIAISRNILGEGAERLVFGLQEFSSRTGEFVGPKLVAKESRHVGEEQMKMDFHELFAETQLTAKHLALTFNERVRQNMAAIGLLPARAWDVTFLDCSVYEFVEEGSFRRGVLVEKLLEPQGCYTKWNGNNGYVHIPSNALPSARANRVTEQLDRPRDLGNFGDRSPGEEAEAFQRFSGIGARVRNQPAQKDANTVQLSRSFAPTAECYVQAFSHFSYFQTRRKMLVCDLQGVQSYAAAGEDRAGVFELTDPVIHYKSKSGRRQVYGKTDLGRKGIDKFFHTHRCNDVCRLLGIGRVDR
ncbi:unnamed protein product [Scytosiphon promiscuus]